MLLLSQYTRQMLKHVGASLSCILMLQFDKVRNLVMD